MDHHFAEGTAVYQGTTHCKETLYKYLSASRNRNVYGE